MEPDIVEEMVTDTIEKGAKITAIIGDEDTTTIARLRAKVDPRIKKLSDCNHIKKPFSSSLYDLRKKHSCLSQKVINYLIKCFNYLITKGKGKPEEIKQNLDALSKHPFGDHSDCNISWCRFIEESGLKYREIQKNPENLANLGSTQSNESFNKSVASKAPKNRFYGGSGSLGYRIAAALAQKNKGHQYTVDVNVSTGLSPGIYTQKLAALRDLQARKRRAVATTKAAKLRRITLKSSRLIPVIIFSSY
ncbi:unnamed protein product [Mytilus coruscus]|uniref:Mutator-like transposase domain-containing protein n=1 Tax=Mytilus coruscus TaxID=42192 RepID=A0A6J8DWF6_MYTCO|nr:unnamed protein product [Mytilus coruscus]